jgi:hypothetical protein
VGAEVRLARPRSAWLRPTLVHQQARLVVLGALGAYFALLFGMGGHSKWTKIGVPATHNWFDDLRGVTSAWDCARQHLPVLPTNTCDPEGRPANYPRLLLLPSHLGLGIGDTHWIGWLVVGLFLAAAVVVVPRGAGIWTGVLYAVVLCSAASMLGVERGNVDLALFALVVVALLVAQRGARGTIGSGVILLVAAALKIFPFFAVGFLVRRGTRIALLTAAGVVVCFAAYAAAIHHQLQQISKALPQADKYSYGLRRVSEWISAGTEGNSATHSSLIGWDILLALAVVAIAVVIARKLRPRLATARHRRDLDFFWAGACVYVVTYVSARNFDYRLVFLLMTVPQLARWAAARSLLAYVTIVALLGTMWLDGWYDSATVHRILDGWSGWTATGPNAQTLPLSAISQLVLFAMLAGWLASTAPLPKLRSR